MMFDAKGRAAGCAAIAEARAEWSVVEAKWGLSDFDRKSDLAALDELAAKGGCR